MGSKMIGAKKLLKARVEKSAIYGGLIAISALTLATLVSSQVTLANIISIQSSNITLWVLDVMPFAFMFWGQKTGTNIVEDADNIAPQCGNTVFPSVKLKLICLLLLHCKKILVMQKLFMRLTL
jgi:hypothetical protein